MPTADLDRLLSAAQNPTRRAILVALLHGGRAASVDEVAEMTDVHRTVAFGHLERLTDAGLLVKSRRRGRQGKPAALYSASGRSLTAAIPPRQFGELARLLAEGLATLGVRGRDVARDMGRRHGASMGDPLAADVTEALRPLQQLGGDYSVSDRQVVARNCIFLEACRDAQRVVCGLHAGLLEGALQAAGVRATVRPAGPLPGGGCGYTLVMPRDPASPASHPA